MNIIWYYLKGICLWLIIMVGLAGGLTFMFKNSPAPSVPNYTIQVIDGCQYLQMHTHNNEILTHKGDCNNPIHHHE